MVNFSKRYIIKIPKDIAVLYCKKNKIITIIGPLGKKSLQLDIKIKILKTKKLVEITQIPFFKVSGNKKKALKVLQGTAISLIKQLILEVSVILYKKLKLVGVGYKAFSLKIFNNSVLNFKLGYSHPIYLKAPNNLNIFCLNATNLFIFGNNYHDITQMSALIRSYKYPEPYKGKGILYGNEKIRLKEGKKV